MLDKEDYLEKIKKRKYDFKLWLIFIVVGNYLLHYTLITYQYILAGYVFLTCISLIGMLLNVQDIRFYNECIKRILEKEKFDKKIKEINNKFYLVFDNMCSNEMSFSKICKDQFAPIIPSDTVKKWKKGNKSNLIIGRWSEDNSPYEIKCPAQLRDTLVKLQNNL